MSRGYAIGLLSDQDEPARQSEPMVGQKRDRGQFENDNSPIRKLAARVHHYMENNQTELGLAVVLPKRHVYECLMELNNEYVSDRDAGPAKEAMKLEHGWVYVERSLLDSSHRNPLLVAIAHTIADFSHLTMHSQQNLVYLLGLPWKCDPRVLLVMDPHDLYHDDPVLGGADEIRDRTLRAGLPQRTPDGRSDDESDSESDDESDPLRRSIAGIVDMRSRAHYSNPGVQRRLAAATRAVRAQAARNHDARRRARIDRLCEISRKVHADRWDKFYRQSEHDAILIARRRQSNRGITTQSGQYRAHRSVYLLCHARYHVCMCFAGLLLWFLRFLRFLLHQAARLRLGPQVHQASVLPVQRHRHRHLLPQQQTALCRQSVI